MVNKPYHIAILIKLILIFIMMNIGIGFLSSLNINIYKISNIDVVEYLI